jgi:hypothetical protein
MTPAQEIDSLKNKIEKLSVTYSSQIMDAELRNNNKLARYQAQLLIKVVSYEIYTKLKNSGTARGFADIEEHVRLAYVCSWIFSDLGETSTERFITMLQWDKDESSFNRNQVSRWKAGTYLRSLDKTVQRDSSDFGALQINETHLTNLKTLSFLYESGVVNFKIKKIKRMQDVMDLPTNFVARCVIETDRKNRGWEWRHTKDGDFNKFLRRVITNLETNGLYSTAFAQKYYNVVPVRTYSGEKFF